MTELNPKLTSREAEEYLLSCIFLDGAETLARCMALGVSEESFAEAPNRLIFSLLCDLLASGKPVELAVLAQELRTRDQLADAGGYAYLSHVSRRVPTTIQADYFAAAVADFATRRTIASLANTLREVVETELSVPATDAASQTIARILGAIAGASAGRDRKWRDMVDTAVETAQAIIEKRPEAEHTQLHWPWPDFDRFFRPMRRKELIVVAARPSVGKSSLMRAICFSTALKRSKHVVIESLEVGGEDIALQAAASMSGHCYTTLSAAHHREQSEYMVALRDLASPALHVHDDRSLAAIIARVKAIHAQRPVDLLAIDYLGLVADCEGSRHETKTAAIGRVTKALKRLAGELDCVVLLLAQLNRASVTDGNREPRLTDLRDSGDIEQDADRVLFLHRPDEDAVTGAPQDATQSADERPRDYINIIQTKGRNVGQGVLVGTYFHRATATFQMASRLPPR